MIFKKNSVDEVHLLEQLPNIKIPIKIIQSVSIIVSIVNKKQIFRKIYQTFLLLPFTLLSQC